jgi:hypothetical protein
MFYSIVIVKNKKLENLDEDFIKDLAGDTEEEAKAKKDEEAAKARGKGQTRTAFGHRTEEDEANEWGKEEEEKGDDVDDEDEALEMFVKRKTK